MRPTTACEKIGDPGSASTLRGPANTYIPCRGADMAKSCSIEGCMKPLKAHGWCEMHYARWRTHGDVHATNRHQHGTLAERFERYVLRGPGCWLWTGALDGHGYGSIYVDRDRGRDKAHRVAYELFIGPIPNGLVIDHVRDRGCAHRNCVNPAHLEPVTNEENILRGDSPYAKKARQTHCKHGHEFTPENTRIRNGTRGCRECDREHSRRQVAARQARAATS